jgi:hypothetical protein
MDIVVEQFFFEDWGSNSTWGVVLAESPNWVLIQALPLDYILDGFKVLNKNEIAKRERDTETYQLERVLRLKKYEPQIPKNFTFGTTQEIMKWVESNYEIVGFQDDVEGETFFGKIREIKLEEDTFFISTIDPQGLFDSEFEYEFSFDSVRIISFDDDYFNAIKLLWKDNINDRR